MKSSDRDEFSRARDYAFLLLKFRPRSKRELLLRLKRKKFPEAAVRDTISFLEEKKFIDDRDFSRAWIASRLGKPYGLRRLRNELISRGVDPETAAAALDAAVRQGYDEPARVRELVGIKAGSLSEPDPVKKKRKIFAYFLRRGFPSDTVAEAIEQVLK